MEQADENENGSVSRAYVWHVKGPRFDPQLEQTIFHLSVVTVSFEN